MLDDPLRFGLCVNPADRESQNSLADFLDLRESVLCDQTLKPSRDY